MPNQFLIKLRERAREIAPSIPYQTIKDSPTIKYYTKWELFDECSAPGTEIPRKITLSDQLPRLSFHVASINGQLSSWNGQPGEVAIRDLWELGEEYSGMVLRSLDLEESRIVALHVANLLGGAYIEVNGDLGRPIKVLNYVDLGERRLVPTHYTVNVRDGARARLELHLYSPPTSLGCPSSVAEVYVGKGAELELFTVSIQGQGPSFALVRLLIGDGARVVARTLLVNGAMNHHREDYLVSGKGASVDNLGLEIGVGTSRIDYLVNLVHSGESSRSSSRVLGIARDRAFVVHRGLGRITEKGKWSETTVEGKVLIAGREAVAASVPIIMVDTGDVGGARHSAADASMDEDQLLYLRMRGIRPEEAIDLLIYEMISQFSESMSEAFTEDIEVIKEWLINKFAKPK